MLKKSSVNCDLEAGVEDGRCRLLLFSHRKLLAPATLIIAMTCTNNLELSPRLSSLEWSPQTSRIPGHTNSAGLDLADGFVTPEDADCCGCPCFLNCLVARRAHKQSVCTTANRDHNLYLLPKAGQHHDAVIELLVH